MFCQCWVGGGGAYNLRDAKFFFISVENIQRPKGMRVVGVVILGLCTMHFNCIVKTTVVFLSYGHARYGNISLCLCE
jgi:hypothetical protein